MRITGRNRSPRPTDFSPPPKAPPSEKLPVLPTRLPYPTDSAFVLRTQVHAVLREWEAVSVVLRSPYLTMAAETLRLGGVPDAALAQRAVAAADAEPEPAVRRQAAAQRELTLARQATAAMSTSAG